MNPAQSSNRPCLPYFWTGPEGERRMPNPLRRIQTMAFPLLENRSRPGKAISEQRPSYYINQPLPAVHAAYGKNMLNETSKSPKSGVYPGGDHGGSGHHRPA